MVEFRKITEDNFEECVSLRVHERQQNYVATNLISLAQAWLSISNNYCVPMPFAIYDGDTMVGFIMMSYHPTPESGDDPYGEPVYSIWRLMIDIGYQQMGYGRQAVKRAVELLQAKPCGPANKIALSYEPDNHIARKLYSELGFVENGKFLDGECVAILDI